MKTDFDVVPTIKYKDLTVLFWKKFPYRVTVRYDVPYPYYNHHNKSYEDWRVLITKYINDRNSFVKEINKSCPEGNWKKSAFGANGIFHYYFVDKDAAQHFIRNNKKYINVVYRPSTDSDLITLKEETHYNRLIRDSLFWNKYKYCIEFKPLNYIDCQEIDEHILNVTFHGRKNSKRFYYPFTDRRRLYLAKEKDILMLLLPFKDKIQRIQEVHIREKSK